MSRFERPASQIVVPISQVVAPARLPDRCRVVRSGRRRRQRLLSVNPARKACRQEGRRREGLECKPDEHACPTEGRFIEFERNREEAIDQEIIRVSKDESSATGGSAKSAAAKAAPAKTPASAKPPLARQSPRFLPRPQSARQWLAQPVRQRQAREPTAGQSAKKAAKPMANASAVKAEPAKAQPSKGWSRQG